MKMCIDVLADFLILGDHVTRDVEVVVVGRDVCKRNELGVMRDGFVRFPGVHDQLDVLLAEAVLGAVFLEAFLGINHKDTLGTGRVLLVNDNDAGRDTGSVEKVCRQTDDSTDPALPH